MTDLKVEWVQINKQAVTVVRLEQVQAALAEKDKQLDTLLGEAVWAMTYIQVLTERKPVFDRAQAFLARPDVREWQERQL